jgi:hypothetical protein
MIVHYTQKDKGSRAYKGLVGADFLCGSRIFYRLITVGL